MTTIKTIFVLGTLCMAGAAQAEADGQRGGHIGMGTGAAAGALIGGPPGALVGAGLGAFFGDRVERSETAERLAGELAAARSQADGLDDRLALAIAEIDQQDAAIAELKRRQALARELELEVMFRTDSSALDDSFAARLERLAALLKAQPSLGVRLDGHADARGARAHNEQLSAARTATVREALIAGGVSPSRIAEHHHGARAARAEGDDLDAHALDRRVVIRLEASRTATRIANRAVGAH